MKIKKLLQELPLELFKGSKELEIKGISAHSKRVSPGDLFLSRKCSDQQDEHYIDEACNAGAVAVLTDFPNPSRKEIAQLVCPNVRALEPKLASFFYDNPSRKMTCVGITGTNGKTTSAFLLHHLLEVQGKKPGLIGTIEYRFGSHSFPAELTTPEASLLQKTFGEMVDFGCKAVVMEASSIGIDQGRTQEVDFDLALFTNFSQDHLDYHQTMEVYALAKQRLFTELKSDGVAVVNAEDNYSDFMVAQCKAPVLTYGRDSSCFLWADEVVASPEATSCIIHCNGQKTQLKLPLLGSYNLSNAMGALCSFIALGGQLDEGCQALTTFPGVPGRFERVENDSGIHVVVDYAHTPDAIERLCKTARAVFNGKIFLVVGAGGNRDPLKRPQMGRASLPYIDRIYFTSDNPRGEDPVKICHQMSEGIDEHLYEIEVDRRKAIEKAIGQAHPGDLILIAGKGHEKTQTIGKIAYPFDDRQVAQESLCVQF
jgi:UDP-N-acetylmuramoyl-L-alanyl-D-glutamate--2,6-diaminopimelate ligase